MTAQIKVKVRPKNLIKLKVLPQFPSSVVGGTGVTVTKTNGIWTISSNISSLVGSEVEGWSPILDALAASDNSPIVILTTGQSNFEVGWAGSHTYAPNLTKWNWDKVDGHVGTAFASLPGVTATPLSLTWLMADEIARANPTRSVRLINISMGSQPIAQWKTGATTGGGLYDMYADCKANVEAALANLGLSSITQFYWWQGESDVASQSTYPASFETVMNRFKAETWFPASTPIVVFGVASTAVGAGGNANYDAMNATLRSCVMVDPDNRKFVYPATFGATYWDMPATSGSSIHLSALGQVQVAKLAARTMMSGNQSLGPGAIVASATWGYWLDNKQFVSQSSDGRAILDQEGNPGFSTQVNAFGGNYHRNTTHYFYSRGGGALYGALSANGWNVTANAAPGTPAAGTANTWIDSSAKILKVKNDAGVTTVTVAPVNAVSHQFLTALSTGGGFTQAQPAAADLSDGVVGTGAVVLKSYADALGGGGGVNKNYLINPSGMIAQVPVGSQTDVTYDFDQWLTLTQTAAITVSQVTDAEDGTPFMMRSLQAQASAQRFGRIQWIEKLFCRDLRSQSVTLSARVRMSASTTLRYAIVEWTGTADAITKDIVNDWTNGTFTAGNFFTSTSTTVAGTGSIALTANTLTSITALTASISSSMNNHAVILWTDSTQAQNVTLDIAKAKLEKSSSATAFVADNYGVQLNDCRRYYEASYEYGVAAGTAVDLGSTNLLCYDASSHVQGFMIGVTKRIAPSVTLYSTNGTSGKWTAAGAIDTAAITANGISTRAVQYMASSSLTQNAAYYGHWVANARL